MGRLVNYFTASFLLILFVAIFLRFYQLGSVPAGVNRDDASIGYTAFSLLTTGKDEYGRVLPFSFEAFGDWKLPLYIYGTIPFVALFGMNDFSVRVLTALAGVGTVVVTFFLVEKLFKRRTLSLLSMALVAIAPWHLHMSRVAGETNLAVFLSSLGALFFFKGLQERRFWYIPSALSFALTYYTYHGSHIFTTLLLLGLFVIYRKELVWTKSTFFGVGVFVVLVGFILSQTLHEADKTKFTGISIFGDPSVVHAKIELPRLLHGDSSLFTRVVHNRVTYALETVFQNYLKGYSPEFLFIKGGMNRAHNILNFGNMYLVEAPFLFLGFLWVVGKLRVKRVQFVFWWLFIAPVAASITKDAPHSTRMFAVFPMLSVAVSLGVISLLDVLPRRIWKWFVIGIGVLVLAFNFLLYWDRYYIHFARSEAEYWGVGYKALTEYIFREEHRDKRVIISNPEASPYIFLLFYSSYPPSLYQQQAVRYSPTEDLFVHVTSFGRFEFREVDLQKDTKENVLVVTSADPVLRAHIGRGICVKDIMLPDGDTFLNVFERNMKCL